MLTVVAAAVFAAVVAFLLAVAAAAAADVGDKRIRACLCAVGRGILERALVASGSQERQALDERRIGYSQAASPAVTAGGRKYVGYDVCPSTDSGTTM